MYICMYVNVLPHFSNCYLVECYSHATEVEYICNYLCVCVCACVHVCQQGRQNKCESGEAQRTTLAAAKGSLI